jgi:hypothetical protein
MELRFVKWNVSVPASICGPNLAEKGFLTDHEPGQNGKQGESKSLEEANAASMAEAAGSHSS